MSPGPHEFPARGESPHRIAELALAASDYVRRAVGLDLDGSVESLAFVDHYMGQAGDVSDELLELLAPALGAYFGEVVLSHLGGEWDARAEDAADWTITLASPEAGALCTFHPVAMAACALRGEDLEEYDASISTPPDLSERLADALANASPVAADYYYSLTGRLETLEHVVELLAALRERDRTLQ
jgi:hypothetical protein